MSLARRLFAAGYDPLMSAAERGWLGRFRALLLDHARGEVVEVGAGTGANLARYHDVIRVHATEPDAEMRRRMERKLDAAPVPVEVSAAPAEDLPFPDASFDTAVSTLVVCSFRDPARALREIRRVLRPDGQYLFLEHGGATGRRGDWQRRLDPIWSHLSAGCHLDRNAADLVRDAGFEVLELERLEPRAPGLFRPMTLGVARP